jgi:hypothetical protein
VVSLSSKHYLYISRLSTSPFVVGYELSFSCNLVLHYYLLSGSICVSGFATFVVDCGTAHRKMGLPIEVVPYIESSSHTEVGPRANGMANSVNCTLFICTHAHVLWKFTQRTMQLHIQVANQHFRTSASATLAAVSPSSLVLVKNYSLVLQHNCCEDCFSLSWPVGAS